MANKGIKGITIEIGGDTSPLEKALKSVNTTSRDLQNELRQVDRLLKFDPSNTELLAQKQKILSQVIGTTEDKLKTLKTAQEQAQQQFNEGKITEEQYRSLTREIIRTEQQLERYEHTTEQVEDAIESQNQALDDAGDAFDESAESANGLGDAISALSGGMGLQEIGSKMSETGKEALGMLGELTMAGAEWETQLDSQQFTFNNLDKEVQNSINNNIKLADSMGMTDQQYKNNATSIANYYKNAGLSSKEIADLSGSTMQLTADMAAFADVPVDEAMHAFKSAMMGNFESMDRYGVNLSVATINESNYAKSLGKKWDKMSQSEKAQAVYNTTLQNTSSFHKLAQKENEQFGTSFKKLQQKIKETTGTIGLQLLPVLAPLVQKVMEIAKAIGGWVKEHPKLTQGLLIVVGAIAGLMAVLGPIISTIGSLSMIFAALDVAMLPAIGTIALVVAGVVAFIAILTAVVLNWETVKAKILEIWDSVITYLSGALTNIGNFISSAFTSIGNAISSIFTSIGNFISNIFISISTTISTIVTSIATFISNSFNNIKNTIVNVFNSVKTFVLNVWNGIKSTITNTASNISSSVSSIWNGIKSTTSSTFNSVKGTVSSVWNGIKNTISNAINGAKNSVSSAINKMKGFFHFSWSLPHIKLPHFTKSGKFSLNPPSVPHFGIKWYKNGGIMTKPTVFGFDGLNAMAGGEAGPEAILPISNLRTYVREELANVLNSRGSATNLNFNISQLVVREEADVQKVSRELYKLIDSRKRGCGNR